MVASPQLGQGNWVAPFAGTARPHDVQWSSTRDSIITKPHLRAGLRRRAATRVTNIKMAPKNATAPATYHSV